MTVFVGIVVVVAPVQAVPPVTDMVISAAFVIVVPIHNIAVCTELSFVPCGY